MKTSANFHILHQVYNFIAKHPGFKSKSELDLLLEFFSAIHEDFQTEIRLDSPSNIVGKFGSREIVNFKLAPSLRNKNEFLKWVYQ